MRRWFAPSILALAAVLNGCAGTNWNPLRWGRDSAEHQVAAMRAQADECRERGDAAQRAGDRDDALYYWQEAAYFQIRANQLEATLR